MIFLLDVNVLLALFDHHHIHHESAHEWFETVGKKGWATCPITENGFIRIASRATYPNSPGDVVKVAESFRQFRDQTGHHFWADSKSLLEMLRPKVSVSSNHVTDIYLLGLAVANKGKLATFDQKIPTAAVNSGSESIELLG